MPFIKPLLWTLGWFLLWMPMLLAQHPRYFLYNDETGLPSNEVYSLAQDPQGFIWMGTNMGLYKFNGVHYIPYKSNSQKIKSVTGLTLSASGRLYCHNFRSQLFYVESADSLKEIAHSFLDILSLASDRLDRLYAAHSGGIDSYHPKEPHWKPYLNYDPSEIIKNNKNVAKSIRKSTADTLFFIHPTGIGRIEKGAMQLSEQDLFKNSPADFELEYYDNSLWVFSKTQPIIYRFRDGQVETIADKKLAELLNGKKINRLKALSDGCLWICTYKGMIRYHPGKQQADLFFPNYSFSDCLLDREGNYWFSTLHTGVLRVPNIDFWVWDSFENNQLTKITSDGDFIYFSNANGAIGKVDAQSLDYQCFKTNIDSDIQSLDVDARDGSVWFYLNNHLFTLQNNRIQEREALVSPVKARLVVGDTTFLATSHGTFINGEKVYKYWSRDLVYDSLAARVWVATNNGLLAFERLANRWEMRPQLLAGIQLTAFDLDKARQLLYVATYDGKLYALDAHLTFHLIATLSTDVQVRDLHYYNNSLYLATNKGLLLYDLNKQQLSEWNTLSGLISNNIQALCMAQNAIWLTTSKGLQRLPLGAQKNIPLASVSVRNSVDTAMQLQYGETLILLPEASSYSSEGQFEYAYRINRNEWIKLPATVERIEIQHVPSGNFSIELKVIDHLGRDSENTIRLSGWMRQPFWKTWQFGLLFILIGWGIIILIARLIIRNIRQKEEEKTRLIHWQLTALKAQMNPHFMYNTLNSIQALILKQDIKNSNLYLSQFSHLMRKVLDVSGQSEISLHEEIAILELYLSLEKLRFGADFTYQIDLDEAIDPYATFLPSLLLQPFVENALKHGLLHKKGEKRLWIRFEPDGEALRCRIRDNGIGRVRAAEIKQRQQEKHASFSTQATQKRLELLNRAHRQPIQLAILDLYQDEKASGTEVVLTI